jgi:hypothetical protein
MFVKNFFDFFQSIFMTGSHLKCHVDIKVRSAIKMSKSLPDNAHLLIWQRNNYML